MSFLQSFFLGIVQGITEFLPISSSGHLILFENVFGLEVAQLKSFDVALHVGTLLAILLYFWKDFRGMLFGIFGKDLRTHRMHFHSDPSQESAAFYRQLFMYLVIGTIPAVLAGIFFNETIDRYFRSTGSVAFMMMFVALVFFLAERGHKEGSHVGLKNALYIGIAQAFALIPGVSRSGATISAGLFQGLKRETAARFSFLLGAPAIFGAGLWTFLKGFDAASVSFPILAIGFLSATLSSLVSVHFLMRFLKNHSLKVFAWYRIVVGLMIFIAA